MLSIRRILAAAALTAFLTATASAQGNLLRNGRFQEDWLTLLPELKNHHWNYTTEVHNRRDYNPDSWRLEGKWEWRDADRPRGGRRLVLLPGSKITQAVNAVTINESKRLEGWPDAGGYPGATTARSTKPLTLVRDLTLRVRLATKDLPADALQLRVGFSAASPIDDPAAAKRGESVTASVPAGTSPEQKAEVAIPAQKWIEAAAKDPATPKDGTELPMAFFAELEFKAGAAGEVELKEAVLSEAVSPAPNLLPDGDFEKSDDLRMVGWSKPEKYRYFPPGVYYIFNTWHNSNSDNRGLVRIDPLVLHGGRRSLQMIVPSGDEVCVTSDPIPLNQSEARLIEVAAWVKTEQLAMLQIDAEDHDGRRLDGFNFIHKNPLAIGTDEWRLVRQVFRSPVPVKSLRLKLCARGMNGYTLDDTGHQPQQNVCGMIWWDDVRLTEPESTPEELAARKAVPAAPQPVKEWPHLTRLDLGERLLGRNTLTAEITAPDRTGRYILDWEYPDADGKPVVASTGPLEIAKGASVTVAVDYVISAPNEAYTEYRGTLKLRPAEGGAVLAGPLWYSTWTVPIDLELGALYLRPEQKQFVRMNLGLSAKELDDLKEVKLDVIRRGTGEVLQTVTVPATPADIAARRARIPDGLRDDFRNLLLTDLDVSALPVQPFADPQRNWVIRATTVDKSGKGTWSMTSPPFCRLAHDGPQPPVQAVKINERGDFLVNGKPWIPWGVTYGHNPVYDGPADSGKVHDLGNLKTWSLYDRHGGNLADRTLWDLNCLRFVEGGGQVKPERLEEMGRQNLYASTVFVPPPTPGKTWPADYLAALRDSRSVVAVSPGPEEAFGHFAPMSLEQLARVQNNVDYLRRETGKPVMVGHGGYWTRLEFERVPFFDIFDPETEPWYPAPLHTDLTPIIEGQPKTVWLRPQMYESVPYERWRYHVLVELIRGARGWQIAHGPGDASTFRGLHGELRRLQPALFSAEKPPEVTLTPNLEFIVRKLGTKTTIVAASTHGMSFGNWRWSKEKDLEAPGRARVTADPHIFRDESDGYHATGEPGRQELVPHGIQNIAHPRRWPLTTKLITWVKVDPKARPKNIIALIKADGRWTHAVVLGDQDWNVDAMRKDNERAFWFLRTFYRHARGFLGWGDKVEPYALAYMPDHALRMGDVPTGGWRKIELGLELFGATGKLIDGVAFLHEGGRVSWARTSLADSEKTEQILFGDDEDRPKPMSLEQTKIQVSGLKRGTRIKVLFEDRKIVADDGFFIDDFRGVDPYQRYGGERTGYGNSPVAAHVYEFEI